MTDPFLKKGGLNMVLVDICNTVADANQFINNKFGKSPIYPNPYITKNYFLEHPECFERMNPIAGASRTLHKIAEFTEIVYITTRPIEAIKVTYEWLDRWGFPKGRVMFVKKDKSSVFKSTTIDFAFEDDPYEINGYIYQGIPVFIKAADYNIGFKNRFDLWEDVLPMVKGGIKNHESF